MLIEMLPVRFAPHFNSASLNLSSLQIQYLADLQSGSCLRDIVLRYLQLGWLVNFRELYELVRQLSLSGALLDPQFHQYFVQAERPNATAGVNEGREKTKSRGTSLAQTTAARTAAASAQVPPAKLKLHTYPFFRSLDPELCDYFLRISQQVQYAADEVIFKQGDQDRDLCLLLGGEAAIFQMRTAQRFIALLRPGTLFGEMGFFLGTRRSATIVATKATIVLRVPFDSAVLDPYMKLEKNRYIVHRFWVQQAFAQSDIFQDVPADCLDALTFAGRIVKINEGHTLFHENELASTAYILLQGQMEIIKEGQRLGFARPGQMIGEVALFLNQGKRSATVEAREGSLLMEIGRNELYKLLAENLVLAFELQTLAERRLAARGSTSL
jgi:CRP/FNR family transcriptional regulator, cyclic AMP receptor protein